MSELTREQVEVIAGKIRNEYIWKHEVHYWLDTDAALRATITQQAQELERVKRELGKAHIERVHWEGLAMGTNPDAAQLAQQLTAMTRERDEWKRRALLVTDDPDYQQCCSLRDMYKQQLAASQARCREMEQERDDTKLDWKHMVYKRDQLSLENSKLTDQIAQLQATLTAREAVIDGMTQQIQRLTERIS